MVVHCLILHKTFKTFAPQNSISKNETEIALYSMRILPLGADVCFG